MKRFSERLPVSPVPKAENPYSPVIRLTIEGAVKFPQSTRAQNRLSMLVLQAQKKPGRRSNRNGTERPSRITEGQPPAKRGSISSWSTNSVVGVVRSPPATPSSLTIVKQEPQAEEAQPWVSTTSPSWMSHPTVQPPVPPLSFILVKQEPQSEDAQPRASTTFPPSMLHPIVQPPSSVTRVKQEPQAVDAKPRASRTSPSVTSRPTVQPLVPPSSLTRVKQEPQAEDAQPRASTTSLSLVSLPTVQPPSPVVLSLSSPTLSAGEEQKLKTQALVELVPAMQPSKTEEVVTITSASASAPLKGTSESSAGARSYGFLHQAQATQVQTTTMNASVDNDASCRTPNAQTETATMSCNPSGFTSTFGTTGPFAPTSTGREACTPDAVSSDAVCNDGPPLLLPYVLAPLTARGYPRSENTAGFPTLNVRNLVRSPRPEEMSSEPADMQAHTPEIISSLHLPSTSSANDTHVAAVLKDAVASLSYHYQQQDSIRSRLRQVDQEIAASLATLEGLKREREELQVKESYTRKGMLQALQCLKDTTLGAQENPTEYMLLERNRTTADVVPPRATGVANQAFVAPQVHRGASPFAFDHGTLGH